jgi:hypothetical protein
MFVFKNSVLQNHSPTHQFVKILMQYRHMVPFNRFPMFNKNYMLTKVHPLRENVDFKLCGYWLWVINVCQWIYSHSVIPQQNYVWTCNCLLPIPTYVMQNRWLGPNLQEILLIHLIWTNFAFATSCFFLRITRNWIVNIFVF